jgi:hypothetical protein
MVHWCAEEHIDRVVKRFIPSNENVEYSFPCIIYEQDHPFLAALFFGLLSLVVAKEIKQYIFIMTKSHFWLIRQSDSYYDEGSPGDEDPEVIMLPIEEVKIRRGRRGVFYHSVYLDCEKEHWTKKIEFPLLNKYPTDPCKDLKRILNALKNNE